MNKLIDIVKHLTAGDIHSKVAEINDMLKQSHFDAEEIAMLADFLAKSGTLIELTNDVRTADIASTGGPSSLSTLLCPLYLRSWGYIVPKLGVPGRPAGGIDVVHASSL